MTQEENGKVAETTTQIDNKMDIKQVQYELNKRPRKKLNFDNPKKIFFASLPNNVAFNT